MRRLAPLFAVFLLLATEATGQEIEQVPEPEGPHVRLGFEDLYARHSLENDDWETEAVAARLQGRLKQWAHDLEESPVDFSLPLADCDGCRFSSLRPATRRAFRSGIFDVQRVSDPSRDRVARGPEALGDALADLVGRLPERQRRIAFKVVRVDSEGDETTIAVLYSGYGHGSGGAVQQNAVWHMRWAIDDNHVRLIDLEVARYEEVTLDGVEPLLADCTESVLGDNPSWQQQLLPDLHTWWRYLDRLSGITFRGYQGLSIADVNGDGLDDLYVAQPGGLPDRLFVQQPDGTANDVSAEAGIDYLELTRSALLVDFDNDGDQDLAAVRAAHIVVMSNDGSGRFRPVAALPLEGAVMASAADYDADGDLDLYGVAYRNPDEGLPPTPYFDAENGQRNTLYRNDGDLRFTDVTEAVGLDENNRRFSFAAVWEDYDNDGDPDVYIANDFGRNNLFRNEGGRFRDVAAEAGVEDISAGMGATWGDIDLDGQMDLYVSNMFSSAGGRVTYQRRFRPTEEESTRSFYQRHAKGNTLFHNQGDGTFTDISEEAGVTMGRWAWGSIFADLDNNGTPDILVPNGFLTNEAEDDL
jgi:hypothetical protein